MKQSVYTSLSNADASVTQNGTAIYTIDMLYASAQGVVTGGAGGTLKLQFSNDIVKNTLITTQPTHWSDIPNASIAVSGAGTYAIPATLICYEYIRVVYTAVSGTGTISCNTKILGA